jgi:predicted ATPase/DNA-binding CsgD family transcriptional regulator
MHSRPSVFSTDLVGREGDLQALAEQLASTRLLTLVGPGGIGKTRLAVEVAQRGWGERSYFVDLAPLRNERLVAEAVADAFGLGELRGRDLTVLLDASLVDEALVVLDNCEHLSAACAEVAKDLFVGCPRVRVLATSQQPLGVPGEVIWPVPPLALPVCVADTGPTEALTAPAVQLFCARASAVKPGFAPGPAAVGAIVEVCRRLDANPLAIELAAARVQSLSPPQIAARLERRFALLSARPGTTESRYSTLAAALAWSHDLLRGAEQALLRRLSVFRGSFDIDAVEEVCAGGVLDVEEVVHLLSGLIAKSFVSADVRPPTARYGVTETVRLYAAGLLDAAGEAAEVGARHARWCVGMVEEAAKEVEGGPGLEALRAEVDNVRAALEWCVASEEPDLGLRLGSGYMTAWEATGRFAEARDWLGRVLELSAAVPASLRARALYHAGFAALVLGELDAARADVEASVAASVEAGDPPAVIERTEGLLDMVSTFGDGPGGAEDLAERLEEARARDDPHLVDALVGCGHARLFEGEPVAAEGHFAELVAVARRRCDDGMLATGLVGMGAAAIGRGDCRRAGDVLREGVEVAATAGEVHTHTIGTIWLAEVARLTGEIEQAQGLLTECLQAARAMGAPYPLALSLLGLGRVALDEGDRETARRHLEEAVGVAAHAHLGHLEAAALDGLGAAALAIDDDDGAAHDLFERAQCVAERCGDKTGTATATYRLAELARARGNLDQAAKLHHNALGQLHAVGAAAAVARSLDALGRLAVAAESADVAARLFGAADGLRRAGGVVWRAGRRQSDNGDVTRLREQLGPDEFEAAWAEGLNSSRDDAVAYATRGRGRRRRARRGFNALTKAERQIVALVAEGLDNGEIANRVFMSRRTVDSHLRRVYPKYDVTSRRELKKVLREQGPPA